MCWRIGNGLRFPMRFESACLPLQIWRKFSMSNATLKIAFQQLITNCKSEAVGRVAEWLKAPDSKSGVGAILPWVRIPPLPPSVCHILQESALQRFMLRTWAFIHRPVDFPWITPTMPQTKCKTPPLEMTLSKIQLDSIPRTGAWCWRQD